MMKAVLVVDDVEDYLSALTRALAADWVVMCARSLAEARQCVSARTPAVALVDVRLSEADPDNRDGLAVLHWITSAYPDLPVAMMSAYRDFDAAVEAVNAGAKAFLKKPIDLRELKQLLASLTEAP